MYCEKCGKKLEDGESCTCAAAVAAAVVPAAAGGAKNVSFNPAVKEILGVLKGAFTAPVKQVSKCAKRTDILWIILAAVEMIIAAVSLTVTFRHLFFTFVRSTMGGLSEELGFGDFAKMLSEMDAGVWKTFGLAVLGVLIIYALCAGLMFCISLIYKRKAGFINVCSMLAAANLPSTGLMLLALIFGWIYAPISALLMIIAVFAVTTLTYLGMQKLGDDKFTVSPFWVYMLYTLIVTVVSYLIGTGFAGVVFEDLINKFVNSVF